MIKNRNIRVALGVVIFLVVAYLGLQLVSSLKSHKRQTNAEQARHTGQPIPVSMVKAHSGRIDSIISAECVARESARASLSVRSGGSVTKVSAKVGSDVKKGQVLVRLDDSGLKTILKNAQQAEAVVQKLKDELQPFVVDIQNLKQKSIVPKVDLLDAIDRQRRSELDLIRTTKERLDVEESIRDTRVIAPIDGVVSGLAVAEGTVVRPYEEMVVVSRLDPVLLECKFAVDALPSVKDFDTADASFPAYHGKSYPVDLDTVAPFTDESSHGIVADFTMPNKSQMILPGMQAVVRLQKKVDGLKIPAISLINTEGDSSHVFVVDNKDVARMVKIKTGRYAEGYVEVKSGLLDGQRVVVVGQGALQQGDTVTEGIMGRTSRRVMNEEDKTLFPPTTQ